LGIDVGPVERVILCRPPGSVARLLQRVGRAGHRPGRGRSGLVLASSAAELVEAAVAAAAARAEGGLPAACEPLRLIDLPLDVLCQQLLGMAVAAPWDRERAWNLVRRAGPYRDLPRDDFDACLAYLSGRRPGDAETERPWLPPRVCWNGDSFSVRDERTVRILRTNSGSILTEETRPVVVESAEDERRLTVGEVAEAFADRLQPGDRFLLDGRCLEFRRLDREAVVVHEVPGRPAVPRWNGDGVPQPPELARRVYLLRARAAEALRDGPQALDELLRRDYGLAGEAVELLAEHIQRQEGVSETPAASGCLVEAVRHDSGTDYYLHTPLNRAGNDALARVAVFRLRRGGAAVTSVAAELGFSVTVRGSPAFADLTPDAWRAVLARASFETDLRETLAESELLRERFRRVALTGLMLLQNPVGRKQRVGGRDWAERRLFERVRTAAPDFVLLRQTWREVLADCCDASTAAVYLETLPRQVLRCRWLARPSPFVEAWTELAEAAAEAVMSPAEVLRRLHAALTGEATA
jgi:ATP-dependent Lhr-like helicase